MTSAAPEPPPNTPPSWQHCRHDATPADPVGCRGIHVAGHTACLAHLADADRNAYLNALTPGTDIDHRGTPFTEDLLHRLLTALHDPTTSQAHIGNAWFGGATFAGDAQFDRATFAGDAQFDRATFAGDAWFGGASFTSDAVFGGASFHANTRFNGATFASNAWFTEATFTGDARFHGVAFTGDVWFDGVAFTGDARFDGVAFTGDARFDRASFTSDARFDRAAFTGDVWFDGVAFTGDARFDEATFTGDVWFDGVTFTGDARFDEATFTGDAQFDRAAFTSNAWFDRAAFTSNVWFDRVTFTGDAWFDGVTFTGDAQFDEATFTSNVHFDRARFETASRLGPLVCGEKVVLDGAVFDQPVTVEMAAREVSCARTRWASTATLHLRYAEVDLRDAVLEYPVVVAARPDPFPSLHSDDPLSEAELSGRKPGVRLKSVGGVDAAHLALHTIDLSVCRFAGAIHLDQLRVDGWCTFATTPTDRGRRFPWRWSRRNTLTEEHHWRVRTARRPARARGWTAPPQDAPELPPAAVATLYRQVRKSLEDGKNEPDAADFYYGECEMRRHDTTRPQGERALLTAYWALSGYGLRATRALVWLGAAMAATVAVMVLWGLPVDEPKPTTTGRQAAVGHQVTLTTDTPDPVNPTGPLPDRVTSERFEKALRVVINSVVFRSSGQDLTTIGTYTEMISRLAEPVLLGLAVLAVRSRVKR
ncbi:pentapeptide repeat-containing protein (plasmid) [Streptomyces californicus]|uniref:Pentapeptide repeat-containing protein n=1 Tax=Streptomyces californicus TaxID=67351 RepID=A0ABX7JEH5_9ACTN|nr:MULTISPECIES: pentapeptide repeat-containing protein [Streptomyces]QRV32527.1 pentapeptide repeat-containing protein [Streptomyces californicus]QRV45942.1 pentapeptide repeat-containing protein [Streptomyces californicus]